MKPYDKVRLKNYMVYSIDHDNPLASKMYFPDGTEGTVISITAKAISKSGFAANVIIKGSGLTVPICTSLLEVL